MASPRAGPPPRPPDDLAARDLPLHQVAAGTPLVRIHGDAHGPLHFGSSSDPRRRLRFDDPQAEYGVCYAAEHRDGAFAETLLRRPGRTLIARSDLEARRLSHVSARAALRLVDLTGKGAARIGATAEVAATREYRLTQAWSRALYEHPAGIDGIRYRCRHDPELVVCALFDRGQPWASERGRRFVDDPGWLGELARRYGIGVMP